MTGVYMHTVVPYSYPVQMAGSHHTHPAQPHRHTAPYQEAHQHKPYTPRYRYSPGFGRIDADQFVSERSTTSQRPAQNAAQPHFGDYNPFRSFESHLLTLQHPSYPADDLTASSAADVEPIEAESVTFGQTGYPTHIPVPFQAFLSEAQLERYLRDYAHAP